MGGLTEIAPAQAQVGQRLAVEQGSGQQVLTPAVHVIAFDAIDDPLRQVQVELFDSLCRCDGDPGVDGGEEVVEGGKEDA